MVEDGDAPLDDAFFLKLLDAPPARRGRQTDFLGDIGDRERRVLLQEAENFSVKAVNWVLPGNSLAIFPLIPAYHKK